MDPETVTIGKGVYEELRAEVDRLTKNAWMWSRGLGVHKSYTADEMKEMFGPYLEDGKTDGLSPREVRMLETIVEVSLNAATMRTALEDIVMHQEAIGGGIAVLSATRRIAQEALEGV